MMNLINSVFKILFCWPKKSEFDMTSHEHTFWMAWTILFYICISINFILVLYNYGIEDLMAKVCCISIIGILLIIFILYSLFFDLNMKPFPLNLLNWWLIIMSIIMWRYGFYEETLDQPCERCKRKSHFIIINRNDTSYFLSKQYDELTRENTEY